VPAEQVEKAGNVVLLQSVWQNPQWCASVARLTQRSLQSVAGGEHAAAQPVGVHSLFGSEHCTSQLVQVVGLDRSASHPSEGSWLQSAKPGSHEPIAQAPLHLAMAWGNAHAVQLPSPQP
jgi:hypothetical protein